MRNRFAVSGGGTGGHIYPAIAIGEGLLERYPGAEVLYIGKEKGMEKDIVGKTPFKYAAIEAVAFSGKGHQGKIKALLQNFFGLLKARRALKKFRPEFIVGTGGYVSIPALCAAYTLGIPVFVHEQNVYPGLANRTASRFAKRVFITFPGSEKYLKHPERARLSGLPIRSNFLATDREESRKEFGLKDEKLLLVTGGSQGASILNKVIFSSQDELKDLGYTIFLITGNTEYKEYAEKTDKEDNRFRIFPYMERMDKALSSSDLVIGRAGASFLAEVNFMGLPGILVPYALAAGDHQLKNALLEQEMGAACMIEEKDFNKEKLLEVLKNIDAEKMKEMGKASGKLGKADVLKVIIDEIEETLKWR